MVPAGLSEHLSNICPGCLGSGKQKAKRKAMTFNGVAIDYDIIEVPCVLCNGAGYICGNTSAPRSHHTEK